MNLTDDRSLEKSSDKPKKSGYAVLLTCLDKDRHQHNTTFVEELSPGLISHGISVQCLDYLKDVRQVTEAMRDDDCLFFVCFNGFGSELMVSMGPGNLQSAFSSYRKPVFD